MIWANKDMKDFLIVSEDFLIPCRKQGNREESNTSIHSSPCFDIQTSISLTKFFKLTSAEVRTLSSGSWRHLINSYTTAVHNDLSERSVHFVGPSKFSHEKSPSFVDGELRCRNTTPALAISRLSTTLSSWLTRHCRASKFLVIIKT